MNTFGSLPGFAVHQPRSFSIPVAAKLLLCVVLVSIFFTPDAGAQASGVYGRSPYSTLEIYTGYGAIQPFSGKVSGYSFQGVHNINATVSVTGYFWDNLGIQVEGGYFNGPSQRGIYFQCAPACSSRDQMYYTAEAGPVVRLPRERVIPFLHVLGGVARINGPYLQPLTWGYGLTAGGGVDYVLPSGFLRDHLAIRGQADFQHDHANYGEIASNGQAGGIANVSAFKITGGLVFRFRP